MRRVASGELRTGQRPSQRRSRYGAQDDAHRTGSGQCQLLRRGIVAPAATRRLARGAGRVRRTPPAATTLRSATTAASALASSTAALATTTATATFITTHVVLQVADIASTIVTTYRVMSSRRAYRGELSPRPGMAADPSRADGFC